MCVCVCVLTLMSMYEVGICQRRAGCRVLFPEALVSNSWVLPDWQLPLCLETDWRLVACCLPHLFLSHPHTCDQSVIEALQSRCFLILNSPSWGSVKPIGQRPFLSFELSLFETLGIKLNK